MPLYPGALWRPIPEDRTQHTTVRKTLVVLHSQGCRCGSLYDDWTRTGNHLESTFWVARSGLVEQYLDSTRRADANRFVNDEAISIETDDDGDPDTQPWWPEQVAAIIDLVRWCIDEPAHAVARQRADGPYGTGVGYHTMWGAPSAWTPVVKTCTGWARIRQFDQHILPAVLSGTTTEIKEVDVFDDIIQGLIVLMGYPAQPSTWDKAQRTSAAWWQDVAKQHGIGNALTLMAAEGRKFGIIA